ncbi:Transmembrane protein, partial [Fusarium oxysporum f. sp. albedinis]
MLKTPKLTFGDVSCFLYPYPSQHSAKEKPPWVVRPYAGPLLLAQRIQGEVGLEMERATMKGTEKDHSCNPIQKRITTQIARTERPAQPNATYDSHDYEAELICHYHPSNHSSHVEGFDHSHNSGRYYDMVPGNMEFVHLQAGAGRQEEEEARQQEEEGARQQEE